MSRLAALHEKANLSPGRPATLQPRWQMTVIHMYFYEITIMHIETFKIIAIYIKCV